MARAAGVARGPARERVQAIGLDSLAIARSADMTICGSFSHVEALPERGCLEAPEFPKDSTRLTCRIRSFSAASPATSAELQALGDGRGRDRGERLGDELVELDRRAPAIGLIVYRLEPIMLRMREVIATDEIVEWFGGLAAEVQEVVDVAVGLLADQGVALGFPYSSAVKGSRTALRELRIQSRGRPLRVFYAFDPRRDAVLLIGGDKTGDDRFYERMVPLADRIYDEHLRQLKDEGLI